MRSRKLVARLALAFVAWLGLGAMEEGRVGVGTTAAAAASAFTAGPMADVGRTTTAGPDTVTIEEAASMVTVAVPSMVGACMAVESTAAAVSTDVGRAASMADGVSTGAAASVGERQPKRYEAVRIAAQIFCMRITR